MGMTRHKRETDVFSNEPLTVSWIKQEWAINTKEQKTTKKHSFLNKLSRFITNEKMMFLSKQAIFY